MTINSLRAGFFLAATALGACTPGVTPAPAPRPATPVTSATGASAQLVARGDSLFHGASCPVCHGRSAKGTPHGPDLTSGRFSQIGGSYEEIVKLITTGVPEDKLTDPSFPEPMPARGGDTPLTDEQIRAVAAYVYSLSHR